MKKIIYTFLAIAALAACNKPELKPEVQSDAFRIYVSTEASKASFNEGTFEVTWKSNETLHVLVNGDPYDFTKVEDEENAFECSAFVPEDGVTYNYEVLTPYNSGYGEGVFTYSGGVKVTMYGQGSAVGAESPAIHMQHLTAIIKTVIENTGEVDLVVNSIRIESDTDDMGGRYRISGGELTPVNPVKYTVMDSQNVSIAAGESKPMFLQCAPFTTSAGSKLTFTLVAGSDTFTIVKEFAASNQAAFHAGGVKTTTVQIGKEAPVVDPVTAEEVFVDFGPTACTDTKWNAVTSNGVAEAKALKFADGTESGLSLAVTSAFSTTWGGAGSEPLATYTEADVDFPKDVYKDALMISNATTTGKVVISGCTAGATYTVKALSFRYNGSRSIRVAHVECGGKSNNVDTGAKSSSDMINFSFVSTFTNVSPDADGNIEIAVSAVKDTRDDVINGYLNALVITKE